MRIAIKQALLHLVHDPASLFFVVFFPTLLTLILGNALNGAAIGYSPVGDLQVLYSISGANAQDEGSQAYAQAAQGFVNGIIQTEDNEFTLTNIDTLPNLNVASALANGDYNGYIAFNADGSLELYEGTSGLANQALEALMRSYATETGAYTQVAQMQQAQAQQVATQAGQEAQAAGAKDGLGVGSSNVASGSASTLVQAGPAGFNRSQMDYYAVAMAVMILFMGGAIGGTEIIYERRKNGMLQRELASPRSRIGIYGTYLLEAFILDVIQVTVIMAASMLLFGVHYAGTVGGDLLLYAAFLAVGMAVSSLFLVVGMWVKVNPMAVLMAPLWILLFLSGTFAQGMTIPGFSGYLPPAMIQNAAYALTVFGHPQGCVEALFVGLGIAIVGVLVGAAMFNRRKAVA
jgi:ABC-2 type transport system permease protein